jgi:hypothetical protein
MIVIRQFCDSIFAAPQKWAKHTTTTIYGNAIKITQNRPSLFFVAGISMHKGYAFVQFTNPFDARNACHGEDGRTVLSQVLGESHRFVTLTSSQKYLLTYILSFRLQS